MHCRKTYLFNGSGLCGHVNINANIRANKDGSGNRTAFYALPERISGIPCIRMLLKNIICRWHNCFWTELNTFVIEVFYE